MAFVGKIQFSAIKSKREFKIQKYSANVCLPPPCAEGGYGMCRCMCKAQAAPAIAETIGMDLVRKPKGDETNYCHAPDPAVIALTGRRSRQSKGQGVEPNKAQTRSTPDLCTPTPVHMM